MGAHKPCKSSDSISCPETGAPGCAFSITTTMGGWTFIWSTAANATSTTPAPPLRNALYRNNRDGTFTDVTEKAGVAGGGYGMGVAVGDYDGDGFPDLYVTQYGESILYHNNGDGTFTDVTEKAGVAAPGWSSSAVWFDYDNDGKLDLFVCRFVEFDPRQPDCGAERDGNAALLHSQLYKPTPSWLFHNNGDGTFTRCQQGVGHCRASRKSLGRGRDRYQ